MQNTRATFGDWVMIGAASVPALLAYLFLDEFVTLSRMTPKLIMLGGVAISVCVWAALLLLKSPREGSQLKLWHRLTGLGVLSAAVLYYFYREEIAEALHWRIRFGDSLAIFLGVLVLLMVVRQLQTLHGAGDAD